MASSGHKERNQAKVGDLGGMFVLILTITKEKGLSSTIMAGRV